MSHHELETALMDLAAAYIADAARITDGPAVRVVRRSGNRWPRALVVHESSGELRCERYTVKLDRIRELAEKPLLRASEFPPPSVFVNFGDVVVPTASRAVIAEIRGAFTGAVSTFLTTSLPEDRPLVLDEETQAVSLLGSALDCVTLEWLDSDPRFAALANATRPICEYLDALPSA